MLRDKSISSGADWELVWTNGDTSVSFGAQTINVDLSNYAEIMVIFKFNSSTSYYQNYYAFVDGGVEVAYLITNITSATQLMMNSRDFEATSSGVSFSANEKKGATETSSSTVTNTYNIPSYIYAR